MIKDQHDLMHAVLAFTLSRRSNYKLIPNYEISECARAGVDESRRKIAVSKRDDQYPICGDSCKSQCCSLLLTELHTTEGDCAAVLDKQNCSKIGAPLKKTRVVFRRGEFHVKTWLCGL